jgi:hypothetical protein
MHTPKFKRKVAVTTPKLPNQPKPLSLQQQNHKVKLTITSSRAYSKSVSGTSAIAAKQCIDSTSVLTILPALTKVVHTPKLKRQVAVKTPKLPNQPKRTRKEAAMPSVATAAAQPTNGSTQTNGYAKCSLQSFEYVCTPSLPLQSDLAPFKGILRLPFTGVLVVRVPNT